MKKIALFSVSLFTVSTMLAQPVKTTPAPVLKNISDSVSYAIGLSVANFYKQQGIKNINASLVSKACSDVMAGKPTLFDETVANNVMNMYMSRMQEEKSKPRIDSGIAFLAKNKLRKEVKVTESGLQYEIITEGTGIKPVLVDTFVCNYKGTLINGTVFDASANRGEPLTHPVSQVIKGWAEGIQLMSVGSKYIFYVPYNLGYGAFDYGPIPGGSLLIFEIELLGVKKGQ
jgi:FKBP-type peptidyl-prolyl cis-trans isomerase FkpA